MKVDVKKVDGSEVTVDVQGVSAMSEDNKEKANNEDPTISKESDVFAFGLSEKDQVEFEFAAKKGTDGKVIREKFTAKVHKLDAAVAEKEGLGKIVK
jgi:hypothetical protein